MKLIFGLTLISILSGCAPADKAPSAAKSGTPEERIVSYLNSNVTPGKPVMVTELANDVFTTPEEQKALQQLYDATFKIPAYVAVRFQSTGKIPSLKDISTHFNFQVPGTTEALLRVLDSDPRAPRFFQRDPTTGEITAVDADAVRNNERFGKHLQTEK